ncbi:hypothetical protein [Streptomyces sp. NPDC057694]|uniref:hypothetical protein n=1 Tax=Streptomyces sp. NPDC057694 TaxID=3346216 RepID=UPI0036CA4E8D
MTGAELVATALATEAAAALTGTTHGLVHELWVALRELIRERLTKTNGANESGGYGLRVLDEYVTDPDVWRNRMLHVLTGAEVHQDAEALAAARAVLRADARAVFSGGAHPSAPPA